MFDIDSAFKLALEDKLTQRQDSLSEQIKDLILIANKLKMYDAATYLENIINN
jgi:hypothetical protein